MEAMDQFKLDLYKDRSILYLLRKVTCTNCRRATVLDFASLSTPIWDAGVRVPASTGKRTAPPETEQWRPGGNMTSNTQTPKRDWLTFVTTSKARNKIRRPEGDCSPTDTVCRRKRWSVNSRTGSWNMMRPSLMRLIRKLGFKTVTDFYQSIANESMDVNDIIDKYLDMQKRGNRAARRNQLPQCGRLQHTAAHRRKGLQGMMCWSSTGI